MEIPGAGAPDVAGKTLPEVAACMNEASAGRNFICQAAAGGADQVTLDADSSAIDDYYVGWEVTLVADAVDSGDGFLAGETRTITAYDGTCLLYTSPSPRD